MAIGLEALPENSGPGGASQWPLSPVPRDTTPSSGLCNHPNTHSRQTHRHVHIQKNKINKKQTFLKEVEGRNEKREEGGKEEGKKGGEGREKWGRGKPTYSTVAFFKQPANTGFL